MGTMKQTRRYRSATSSENIDRNTYSNDIIQHIQKQRLPDEWYPEEKIVSQKVCPPDKKV